MKKKSDITIGDKVVFNSGNYEGFTGVVTKVDFYSTDKRAMFGYLHEVKLSNEQTGYIEKGEHWEYAKS